MIIEEIKEEAECWLDAQEVNYDDYDIEMLANFYYFMRETERAESELEKKKVPVIIET